MEDRAASGVADFRCESAMVEDIAVLQSRLHTATDQLVLANSHCVKQDQTIDILANEKDAATVKIRNLERENAALRRRLEVLEPGEARMPRPGPSLKPFEDLTPRQQKVASSKLQDHVNTTSEERKIHPVKLSAYLTFRYIFH